MIEIIKKGEKPVTKKYIKKCRNCKTVFSYQREDMIFEGSPPDDWHYAVVCPVCDMHLITSIFDRRDR